MKNVHPYRVRFQRIAELDEGHAYLFDEASKLPIMFDRVLEGMHHIVRQETSLLQKTMKDLLLGQPLLGQELLAHLMTLPEAHYRVYEFESFHVYPGMSTRVQEAFHKRFLVSLSNFFTEAATFQTRKAIEEVKGEFVSVGEEMVSRYEASVYDDAPLVFEDFELDVFFRPDFAASFALLERISPAVHAFLSEKGILEEIVVESKQSQWEILVTVEFDTNNRIEVF